MNYGDVKAYRGDKGQALQPFEALSENYAMPSPKWDQRIRDCNPGVIMAKRLWPLIKSGFVLERRNSLQFTSITKKTENQKIRFAKSYRGEGYASRPSQTLCIGTKAALYIIG